MFRALTFLLALSLPLSARDAGEDARIDALLAKVASLQGATFFRNGSGHEPKEAAKHLRMKLKRAGERVKTAEDFIQACATKSSLTARPYKIRFADGTEKECGPYLRAELARIDGKGS